MFKRPAQQAATQSNAGGEKPARAPFLSPLVDAKDLPFIITGFRLGENRFRLCPTFGAGDTGMTYDLKALPVKYTLPDGRISDGTITADDWFWKGVNPFLMQHYKARFKSKKNPNGDVQLRTRTSVLFWAILDTFDENKQPTKTLALVRLPGASYEGAPYAIGDSFKGSVPTEPVSREYIVYEDSWGREARRPVSTATTGGSFFKDFDIDTGRELIATVTRKDPNDPTTKMTTVAPAQVPATDAQKAAFKAAGLPAPASVDKVVSMESLMNYLPKAFIEADDATRPSLSTFVRHSGIDEVRNCLKTTLPQDVYEHLEREVKLENFFTQQ